MENKENLVRPAEPDSLTSKILNQVTSDIISQVPNEVEQAHLLAEIGMNLISGAAFAMYVHKGESIMCEFLELTYQSTTQLVAMNKDRMQAVQEFTHASRPSPSRS